MLTLAVLHEPTNAMGQGTVLTLGRTGGAGTRSLSKGEGAGRSQRQVRSRCTNHACCPYMPGTGVSICWWPVCPSGGVGACEGLGTLHPSLVLNSSLLPLFLLSIVPNDMVELDLSYSGQVDLHIFAIM